MATLAGVDSLQFNQLKAELGLTDGNLSSHAAALERAGYAKIHKGYKGRRPRTTIAITAAGRKALARYVSSLQRILNKARSEPAK